MHYYLSQIHLQHSVVLIGTDIELYRLRREILIMFRIYVDQRIIDIRQIIRELSETGHYTEPAELLADSSEILFRHEYLAFAEDNVRNGAAEQRIDSPQDI